MRIQRTKYTVGVSQADLAATNTALAAVSSRFVGMFSIPLIQEDDPDDLDPPRYWCTVVRLNNDERAVLKAALSGIASLHYQEVDARKPKDDEDLIDAWAASYGYRRREHILEAYGTALATGSASAQDTTTTVSLLNQWTSLIKLINMDNQGQRFKVITPGTYELAIRLNFTPVEGVTFTAQAARNVGVVGATVDGVDGLIQGKTDGMLATDDLIGIAIKSSSPASFKLLGGSKIRLRRIA